MRIAHISDLHICTRHRIENLRKFESLLHYALQEGADHFAVTGDISHNAYSEDFEAVRQILQRNGLLDPQKLSVTIGNHDIFGGVHFAEDILEFPGKCRRTNLQEQVDRFTGYFSDTFENTFRPLQGSHFPYFKDMGNFMFIGLNSIAPYSRLQNPLASNGRISSREFEALKSVLESEPMKKKQKIVLIHHHFTPKIIMNHHEKSGIWNFIESHTMKIYGRNKLISLFAANGIKLVLHGHVHINHRYDLNGVTFLNGGASVGDNHNNNLAMNLIDLKSGSFDVRMVRIQPNMISTPRFDPHEELIPRFASL